MLDINLFRPDRGANIDIVIQSQKARFASIDIVHEIVELDKKYRETKYNLEKKNAQLNKINASIKSIIKSKGKHTPEYHQLIADTIHIKSDIRETENILSVLEIDLNKKLSTVGNIVHAGVVHSNNENDNAIVNIYGTKPEYDFPIKPHYQLMNTLSMIETARANSISGHRAYFLKDHGVLLNQALINYSLNFCSKKNYTLLQPPFYMNADIMCKTAQLSDFHENLYQMTTATGNSKYLSATSEQPISAYHANEIIDADTLPLKYCGLSTCFRAEAGSSGRDVQGIFRVHQFEKIEQFCITTSVNSEDMFADMIDTCVEFYTSLGLHFRVVNIISGALNNTTSVKYDLEAWFPESSRFRELVSCSNCTDYQSRSMNIRTNINGQREYVHCLNATLCATQRTMCALVETHQTATGINIPPVLQPYLGCDFLPYK